MPRPKQLLKEDKAKKSKKKIPDPSTADEFLGAGVEFEEAGEKWRGGDPEKSLRFFDRAVATYDEGLQKFPQAFDLAYNKARLQFSVTQHPKLAVSLKQPILALLKIALESHRYALSLQQENADLVFNTAQVLVAIVELVENEKSSESTDSARLLEEAIELFQRCLSLQESQLSESQAEAVAFEDVLQTDADMELDTETSTEPEEWAMIVEPVTYSTLVDTALAQIEALTLFCTIATRSSEKGLEWIEKYTENLLRKATAYAKETQRVDVLQLPQAVFLASLLDSSFREGKIELETYQTELEKAFADITANDAVYLPKADALIGFAVTVGQASRETTKKLEWDTLTQALDYLKQAAKSVSGSSESGYRINMTLADTELLRHRLADEPEPYPAAVKSATVLLKNAEVYYRGAMKWAQSSGTPSEAHQAQLRETILSIATGADSSNVQRGSAGESIRQAAVNMYDEGLLSGRMVAKLDSTTLNNTAGFHS